MPVRDIIEIDEALCNGCGQCATACKEGAIQIIDGKAKLVRDDYCDGLGACLGECPTDALKIVRREAPGFDEAAALHHAKAAETPAVKPLACGCPGTHERVFARPQPETGTEQPSMLTHWPIQLKLINPDSPIFEDADILIAADCTAFALGAFHRKLLRNRSLVIACPKLDTHDGYHEKLVAIFRDHTPRSITVARMEVPCCAALTRLVQAAHAEAGCTVPLHEIIISTEGAVLG